MPEEKFFCIECGEQIDPERVKALMSLSLAVELCSHCKKNKEAEEAQWTFITNSPKGRPIRLSRKKPVYF